MFNISDYLSKFKHILGAEKIQKDIVVSVLKSEAGINIDSDIVSVKRGVALINGSPALKSTIFLHKEKILTELKSVTENKIFDIR